MTRIAQVRLSTKAKEQLSVLKRRIGLGQWNILCRWGFCLSLSEPSRPQEVEIKLDSNVEMSWRTFTGVDNEDLYLGLLKARCIRDKVEMNQETLNRQFILHLHRGISYLASQKNIKSINALLLLTRPHHKKDMDDTGVKSPSHVSLT